MNENIYISTNYVVSKLSCSILEKAGNNIKIYKSIKGEQFFSIDELKKILPKETFNIIINKN